MVIFLIYHYYIFGCLAIFLYIYVLYLHSHFVMKIIRINKVEKKCVELLIISYCKVVEETSEERKERTNKSNDCCFINNIVSNTNRSSTGFVSLW
jgi:hypothetical protein